MEARETLSVDGTLAGVREAVDAFERFGGRQQIAGAARWRLALALDEILSNVVRHGGPPAGPIAVTFALDDGGVRVEIVDGARPFNPLLAPPPDTRGGLDRRPGGLGIALVRQLVDEAAYERRADRNHLIMRCRTHADR